MSKKTSDLAKCKVVGCSETGKRTPFGPLCDQHLMEKLAGSPGRKCSIIDCNQMVTEGSNFCAHHLDELIKKTSSQVDRAMLTDANRR